MACACESATRRQTANHSAVITFRFLYLLQPAHQMVPTAAVPVHFLRFAQSANADRAQSRGCPFGPASGSDPGLVHHPFISILSVRESLRAGAVTRVVHNSADFVASLSRAAPYIDASGRGHYDPPAQHEGLTTWCSGRAHTHRISVRRAHRLSPKGHGPPTATT